MSRLCPGLPDFAALSRNPARLYKWRCGTSINSVYYRISVRISRCLVGVAVHDRPKVGVVDQKWAWSVNFRARFARVNTIFYFVPVSLLINLATMHMISSSTVDFNLVNFFLSLTISFSQAESLLSCSVTFSPLA